jgi:hypothetical protein
MLCIALLFALTIVSSQPASAQLDVRNYEFGKTAYGFHGVPQNRRITTFQAESEASRIFQQVIGAQGLSAKIEIRASGDVENAAAFLDDAGNRIIAYNAIFMEEVKQKTGRYWSLISIMAHEVGHHLNFHTYAATSASSDQLQKDELEADYFSGHVLARLGASLDESLAAIRALSPTGSFTHPARDARLQAIALGWKAGGGSTRNAPGASAAVSPPAAAAPGTDSSGCLVADTTGTPLNVRAAPQGAILSALPNGVRVRIAQSAFDQKGQEWARIVTEGGDRLGWVIRRYLSCP